MYACRPMLPYSARCTCIQCTLHMHASCAHGSFAFLTRSPLPQSALGLLPARRPLCPAHFFLFATDFQKRHLRGERAMVASLTLV